MSAIQICPSMEQFNALKSAYEGHSHSGYAAKSEAIKSITRSGTTFTATRCDGTTFTFSQQDNNTLPGVTFGRQSFNANITSSWWNHYFAVVALSFANQGTTAYNIVVTPENGGAIMTATVKAKRTNGADVFVMLPYSGSNTSFTLNYIIVK